MHHVGVDFYPEHWPRDTWPTYARQMREAGFTIVRLAEFAWAMMEPEEGRYDFSLFDDAIAVLAKENIKVILCTPTAVMPAWLAAKYPEALFQHANGLRKIWGVRKDACFTSGAFRLLSERITSEMSRHFATNPHVVGWQTDNEFGDYQCYCASCVKEFRQWCRNRYGTIEDLNQAWGTHFWGHVYYHWDEITIPEHAPYHHPGHLLDWTRFGSWVTIRFQDDQIKVLRQHAPGHFITHNCMGLFSGLDYYEFAKNLDFVSYDNYPVTGMTPADITYDAGQACDVMRGLKKKNFWIMEQTAGPAGWGEMTRNVRPGELRKIAFQAVGHGADATIWFRWRTCTVGREQYWHGLLGHDGVAGRRYREAAAAAGDFHKLEGMLEGTTVATRIAVIYDYDSIWAVKFQKSYDKADYHANMRRFYNAITRRGLNCDMIRPGTPLDGYKIVVAPMLHVLADDVARQLVAFVEQGGVLIADHRTAVKDVNDKCIERTLPGLLSPALGIAIEEYESLSQNPGITYPSTGHDALAGTWTAQHWADWVQVRGAEALATYSTWHMTTYALATRHRHGSGWGYYVGAVVAEDAFYDRLIADVCAKAGITSVIHPPAGVEVCIRAGAGRRIAFVINHSEEPKKVEVPSGKTDLLSGSVTTGTISLDRFGVAVLAL